MEDIFKKYRVGIKSSIGPTYRKLLYDIVIATKPKNVLEIGSRGGYSTSAFLEALNQGADFHLTACDPKPSRKIHERVFNRCQRLDRVNWQQEYAQKIISPEFDLVFADGDHSTKGVFEEIRLLIESDIETIIAHDTWIDIPKFQGAWLYRYMFSHNEDYYYIDDNKRRQDDYYQGCGISYMTRSKKLFEIVKPLFHNL